MSSDEETDEPTYEVESIQGHRIADGGDEYFVHWAGFDGQDTW